MNFIPHEGPVWSRLDGLRRFFCFLSHCMSKDVATSSLMYAIVIKIITFCTKTSEYYIGLENKNMQQTRFTLYHLVSWVYLSVYLHSLYSFPYLFFYPTLALKFLIGAWHVLYFPEPFINLSLFPFISMWRRLFH